MSDTRQRHPCFSNLICAPHAHVGCRMSTPSHGPAVKVREVGGACNEMRGARCHLSDATLGMRDAWLDQPTQHQVQCSTIPDLPRMGKMKQLAYTCNKWSKRDHVSGCDATLCVPICSKQAALRRQLTHRQIKVIGLLRIQGAVLTLKQHFMKACIGNTQRLQIGRQSQPCRQLWETRLVIAPDSLL